jgi:phage terminase large subunit
MLYLSEKQQLAIYALRGQSTGYNRVLYGGAAGGGKTYLGCIDQITARLDYPDTRGYIARKNRTDLVKSTFKTFVKVYNEIAKPRIGAMKYNGQDNVISFPNGSEIFLMYVAEKPGDPEFQSLGSYEFTDGFIDECGEVSKNAADVLYSRTRHNLINGKKSQLLCSNPSYGWLKDTWVEKDKKKIILPKNWKYIPAYVEDNPDKEFVRTYKETLEELPLYHRKRLLEGDWNYQVNDSPYYPNVAKLIITDVKYNPMEEVLISMDFNFNPVSATLMQKYDGKVRVFKTFQNVGTTREIAAKIRVYLDSIGCDWIKLTGDHTSFKSDTRTGILTDFHIAAQELDIPISSVVWMKNTNPLHGYSRDLITHAIEKGIIEIDSQCEDLIIDFNKAIPDSDGKLYKNRDGYKMDLLDSARYGIHYFVPTIKEINNITLI